MKKPFLLLTLVAAICINNAVFAQSDWDAVWQGDEWNNFYEKVQYTNPYNTKQNTQQYNTKTDDKDICKGREGERINTGDSIIYCPGLKKEDRERLDYTWKTW